MRYSIHFVVMFLMVVLTQTAAARKCRVAATASPVSAAAPTSTITSDATSTGIAPLSSTIPASAGNQTESAAGVNDAPNGKKAGIAGADAYDALADHLGWWSDYSPVPSGHTGKSIPVGMLWGDGHIGSKDAARLAAFKKITTAPKYMMGFFEPDWTPPDSSNISVATAAPLWNELLAPLGQKGTKLLSPSMAKQKDEDWLTPFKAKISYQWDYTSVHVNQDSLEKVKAVIDYYLKKYEKPIWVSEFACVASGASQWQPCTNQNEIDKFINDVVPYFENHPNITAYGYSNGNGLGTVWPLTDSNKKLQASGKTYLAAISKFS